MGGIVLIAEIRVLIAVHDEENDILDTVKIYSTPTWGCRQLCACARDDDICGQCFVPHA